MAVLTNPEYGEMRNQIYQFGSGKDELKLLASLPGQVALKAAFQVMEDFWEDNKVAVKADLDTALGFTTSAALAKKIGLTWLIWKASKGG